MRGIQTAVRSGRSMRRLAPLLVLALMPRPALAAPPTQVLIVRGESPDLPGGRTVVDAIEAAIQRHTTPVDFYTETIETGRFSGEAYRAAAGRSTSGEIRRAPPRSRRRLQRTGRGIRAARADQALSRGASPAGHDPFARPRRTRASRTPPPCTCASIPRRRCAWRSGASRPRGASSSSAAARGPTASGSITCAKSCASSTRTSRSPTTSTRRSRTSCGRYRRCPPTRLCCTSRCLGTRPGRRRGRWTCSRRCARPPTCPSSACRARTSAPAASAASCWISNGTARISDSQAVRMLSGERPASLTTPALPSVDWRELQRFQIPLTDLAAGHGRRVPVARPLGARQGDDPVGHGRPGRGSGIDCRAGVDRPAPRATRRLLEARLRFERALSELAVSLAPVPPESIDEVARRGVEPGGGRAGDRLGVAMGLRYGGGRRLGLGAAARGGTGPVRRARGSAARAPPPARRGRRDDVFRGCGSAHRGRRDVRRALLGVARRERLMERVGRRTAGGRGGRRHRAAPQSRADRARRERPSQQRDPRLAAGADRGPRSRGHDHRGQSRLVRLRLSQRPCGS